MQYVILCIGLLLSTMSVLADKIVGTIDPDIPDTVKKIRLKQQFLEHSTGVMIKQFNQGKRSSSSLGNIPPELEDTIINDERDLEEYLKILYPYYGFSETESLRYAYKENHGNETAYIFYQYIRDVRTNLTLSIWVDIETFMISRLQGALVIDRDLERTHAMDANVAIKHVINYVLKNYDSQRFNLKGEHMASLVYRQWGEDSVLTPWWQVEIERKEAIPYVYEYGSYTHDVFFINPEGGITSLIQEGTSDLFDVLTCDGSAQTTLWCSSSSNPTVINTGGICQSGYNCSGPDNIYQTPHDTVTDTKIMWEDVVSIAQDDPDTLFVGLDDLDSEEELKALLIERYGEDVEYEITPEVSRILAAKKAGREVLRETLTDIVGQEVILPGDTEPYAANMVIDRLSTDEVLARMRTEHVAVLVDRRDLLDDEQRLMGSIRDMKGIERAAALEFLAMMQKSESMESMYSDEHKRLLQESKERGWYDMPGPARGSHMLRELAESSDDGLSSLRRDSIVFEPHGEHITKTSTNYSLTLPDDGRIEVFSETSFGGVLYIEKDRADEFHPHDANLYIAGHDGIVATGRHDDGIWVTTVTAFDGRHVHRVVLERKLEGADLDEFVRMATDLIEAR